MRRVGFDCRAIGCPIHFITFNGFGFTSISGRRPPNSVPVKSNGRVSQFVECPTKIYDNVPGDERFLTLTLVKYRQFRATTTRPGTDSSAVVKEQLSSVT